MRRRGERQRRGLTMVETAVVLFTLLILILGMMDVALAILRYHVVCEAARQGARCAIVHGSTTPSDGTTRKTTSWSPATGAYPGSNPYAVNGNNTGDAIANVIQPYLTGVDPKTVTITIQWLDPSSAPTNDVENRVCVTVTTTWTPMMGFLLGGKQATLAAASTMPIAF